MLYASTDQPAPPKGSASINIDVDGQQYVWRFQYPKSEKDVFSYVDMVVPVGMTSRSTSRADDVIHSWWIPKLGGKMDAVPGYTNKTWFKIPESAIPEGKDQVVFHGQCAELCGRNHANMLGRVIGMRYPDYKAWVDRKAQRDQVGPRAGRQVPRRDRQAERRVASHGHDLLPDRDHRRDADPRASRPAHHLPRVRGPHDGWTSWFTTTDHKKIGIMYLYTVLVFFVLGGVEALLIRVQLGAPENTLVTPEVYNQLFTMHGTTMIFLVVVPVWAGFANYLLPLMIGARDVAFPRLNAWSYWMFLFGGLALYASVFFSPPEAGWFSYVPLSSKEYSPSNGQEAWIYMVHLTGLASILGAINFIATIHNMRAPGMGWGRMPLFVWTILIYAYLIILALTSLAATVTMLLLDRNFGTNFFDPDEGGSALLWQHLFWFFGHPEVYILVLPAFGVFSEILPVFARKPIFGYKAIAAATAGIAFLGVLVWAHHMFATPMSTVVLAFFMLSSFLIAVPTGVKIFNWIATLWRGTVEYRVPLLYCIGGIFTFLMGGITGIFLAVFPIDWQLTDTYFVVAHFHYTAFGASAVRRWSRRSTSGSRR